MFNSDKPYEAKDYFMFIDISNERDISKDPICNRIIKKC